MKVKAVILCFAALVCAVPVAAQQRGTMEFGAFASAATFDEALSLKSAFGGGGRIGMFLDPRWAIEFEDAEMRAKRPNGLKDVNVGLLSGRLVFAPIRSGAFSVLLGGGAGVSTETNFMHSYGVDALAGIKFDLSLYRHPSHVVDVVTVRTPAPPAVMMAPQDSVSAAEIRRLRDSEAALRALRDSLSRLPVRAQPSQNIPMKKDVPLPPKP
jgi:hypothetical protein